MAKADKKNDTDGGFLDTISDAIEDVMEDAMDDIKEAGEAVVQGVNTLVDNIKDGAEVVVDKVQDAIEDVGEALGIIAVDEVRHAKGDCAMGAPRSIKHQFLHSSHARHRHGMCSTGSFRLRPRWSASSLRLPWSATS
jgi:hypothetical protein